MGWYFGYYTRAEMISELTKSHDGYTCLAKFTSGNTLWTVWEFKLSNKQQMEGVEGAPYRHESYRFIGCALMKGNNTHRDGWGYKDMTEEMRPYYYSCPLKYLDMVPEDGVNPTNAEWRGKVREYHAKRSTKGLKVGTIIGINGRPRAAEIVSLNPIIAVTREGGLYRIYPRHLTGERWGSWVEFDTTTGDNNNA